MKQLTRVVQAVAVVCTLVTIGLLFLNEPDDAPAPTAAEGEPEDVGDDVDGEEADDVAEGEGEGDGDEVDGSTVYGDLCASCHGGDGGGGIGPQLADGAVVDAFPDVADEVDVVTAGRGRMPAFGNRLSEAEIQAVVEFTRSL